MSLNAGQKQLCAGLSRWHERAGSLIDSRSGPLWAEKMNELATGEKSTLVSDEAIEKFVKELFGWT